MGVQYVYNPALAPQIHGQINIPGKSYVTLDEKDVKLLRDSEIPVLFEGDPNFPTLWVTYPLN